MFILPDSLPISPTLEILMPVEGSWKRRNIRRGISVKHSNINITTLRTGTPEPIHDNV